MADPSSSPPSTAEPTEPDDSNPTNPAVLPPPAAIPSFAPPTMPIGTAVPPVAPSFRPVPPQFTPLPNMQNLAYQNPGVQPPGVGGAVPVSNMLSYSVPPGQQPNPAMRPYMTMPNGYAAVPMATGPHGSLPPPVS